MAPTAISIFGGSMQHKGTVTLETPRLILRRYRPDDAGDMYRNWAQSEAVTEFLTWPPYRSVTQAEDYIRSVIDSYDDPARYIWVIEDKESCQAVGSIDAVELREDIACATIGYCIGERYWGRGMMTEAFGAVIRYLFDEVGVNRIEAAHDVRNPASGRVMEKCGLRCEGTLRQAGRNNQGIHDVVMRAILRKDYRG